MLKSNKRNNWRFWLAGLGAFVVLGLTSCSTTESGAPKEAGDEDAGGGGGGGSDDEVKQQQEKDDVQISGSLRTFVLSNSNNPMTSHTVNREKAASMAQSLEDQLKNPKFKDRLDLVGLMSIQAVAGITVDNMLSVAQKLVNLEMGKDIRRDMPEVATLQIVISSIRSRNFAMAEHFMTMLEKSKNKKVRAGLLNAEGLIALLEDRIPEAIYSWNEALKVDGGYEPAKLNIGFVALRYGDYQTANRMLSNMQDDWFAQTGLLIAARIAGDDGRVRSLCSRVLGKKKHYKPAMLSCALHKYESEKKYDEAIKLLQEVAKAQPSIPSIDEKAFKLIGRIEEESRAARMKADEAKQKREAKEKADKALKEADKMLKGGANGGNGGAGGGGAAPEGNDKPQ